MLTEPVWNFVSNTASKKTEMKSVILILGSILKVAVIIIGVGLTIWNLIKRFSDKDEESKKKALKYSLLTFGIIFLITVIEFLIAHLA